MTEAIAEKIAAELGDDVAGKPVMGWSAKGKFVGRFHSHEKARKANAAITKTSSVWFVWGDERLPVSVMFA